MTAFLTQVMREIGEHFTAPSEPVVRSAPAPVERRDQSDAGQAYRALFGEALRGEGDFWPTGPGAAMVRYADSPKWDNEQQCAIFSAVCRALRMPGASPAEKWAHVEDAVKKTVHVYADAKTVRV